MTTLSRCALVCAVAIACALPAQAGGPVPIRRDELPPAIAKLHTCVPKAGWTQYRPSPDRAGNAGVVISVSCPVSGPDVAAIKTQYGASQVAMYLARGRSGIGAKRLTFPTLNPDGSMTTLNVLPTIPLIGWSTKHNNSDVTNAAIIDIRSLRLPNNAFHIGQQFEPLDRPGVARVIAIWQYDNGEMSLIYWAETADKLRGRHPDWIHPKYRTVLDRRPES